MKEDSINSFPSVDDEKTSTKTMETLSVHSIGIDDWAVECFNLNEIASRGLPQVVRLAEESPGSAPKRLEHYLNSPLLFHSVSKKAVIKCRVLEKNPDGKLANIDSTLLIPENYDGFFAILPEAGKIPSYSSISDIASVMPKRFFTCTKMVALCIMKAGSGSDRYIQKAIPEASVLKVDGVFNAKWKTEAETGIFKTSKMSYTTSEIQYLKCIDSSRTTVYIPYTTEGKFYTLFDGDISNRYALYKIKDIYRAFDFPLNVRLIYGTSPVDDTKFTNLLCLNSKEQIKSIITSTIGLKRNVLLDIPVCTSLFVNLPAAEDNALELEKVKTAIASADKYVPCFNRRIKRSLFKMDELTEEKEEEEEKKKVGYELNAERLKREPTANFGEDIPLKPFRNVKTDSKESNDWDEISLNDVEESENMDILESKKKPKNKLHMKFNDIDLNNSTIV